jgi:hypothetical protein
VLDKFAAIQMLDVHFPTTDGRTLILSRYNSPPTKKCWSDNSNSIGSPHHASPHPPKPFAPKPSPRSGDFRYAFIDIVDLFRRAGKVGL